ncbi:MAG: hypothetical protein R3F19_03685 [Verrucomicrobiales bacterium]
MIVNATIHEEALSGLFERGRPPSKHPGLFGVDLHIDDSKGIAIEAELFGFRALIIDPENLNWGASILDSVRALAINQRSRHYDEYERKRQSEQPRFYGGGEVIHREPLRKQSIGFVATHERLKLSL